MKGRYLAETGSDPRQAPVLWPNLVSLNHGESRPPRQRLDHPDPGERAATLEPLAPSLLSALEWTRGGAITRNVVEFAISDLSKCTKSI